MGVWEQRITNFRGVLSKGVDAVFLANYSATEPNHHDYNLYYASNLLRFFPWAFLVLTKDQCGLWVHEDDLARAREQSSVKRVEPVRLELHSMSQEFGKIAARKVKELTNKKEGIRVGVNGKCLPSFVSLALLNAGLRVVDVAPDLERSRLVKDEVEIGYMRKAAGIAAKGVERVMDAIHQGITERELSILAEYEMRRRGAECFWWPSLIASGPKAERWADSPNLRKIRRGDLLWMDFTPVYMGYGGDIARAFVYGRANETQLEVFRLAEKVLGEAASSLRNGVTIREVMEAAAEPVMGSPYEKFYIGPGHGIGLYNDIYPTFLTTLAKMKLLPRWLLDTRLMKGMIFAIEIIFTVPGVGGVRLEDDYLITGGKAERLTKAPLTPSVV
jgi:Xaa-Pro aminopeptidase